jgi:D-psicose/D-tagatose/L-ribulose 3-epimerase
MSPVQISQSLPREMSSFAKQPMFFMNSAEQSSVAFSTAHLVDIQALPQRNRANSVAAMQRLSDYAADKGININLEVVNRYESNIMNTGIEGLAFLDEVNRPNAFVHLDTYHMNIEEDGMEKSVLAAGDRLGFVHIGESHRGYLGSGNVDFDSFFAALKKVNYQGPITFESFSSAVVDPALSNTLCVWRNLWSDSDDLASTALAFMKERI